MALKSRFVGTLGIVLVASVVALLLYRWDRSPAHESGVPPPVRPAAEQPEPPTPSPNPYQKLTLPPTQYDFCDVVESSVKDYMAAEREGANEIRLSKLRRERALALKPKTAKATMVDGWLGVLAEISTTSTGKAAVKILLPCDISRDEPASVRTWNNELSDAEYGTLISPTSKLYESLAGIKVGSMVRFSGKFGRDSTDGVRELSISEKGGMTSPEFMMRFTSVESIEVATQR